MEEVDAKAIATVSHKAHVAKEAVKHVKTKSGKVCTNVMMLDLSAEMGSFHYSASRLLSEIG